MPGDDPMRAHYEALVLSIGRVHGGLGLDELRSRLAAAARGDPTYRAMLADVADALACVLAVAALQSTNDRPRAGVIPGE